MSIVDKLIEWDELRVQLEAANRAGMELAEENADLRIENGSLKRELAEAEKRAEMYKAERDAVASHADERIRELLGGDAE